MADPTLWERQRRTFEHTAEAYDRFRPTYPDELFEDVRDYAALEHDDRILEVGCGTGQATLPLARWGHPIVAIEPAPAMADVAKRKLAAFNHVDIRVTTLEGCDLDSEAFGLTLSAQAFHWLDKETRYRRIADALRPGGTLALVWNTQVTPAHNRPFYERAQEVYLRHAPHMAHKGDFITEPGDEQLADMASSGLFEKLEVRRSPWRWTLARDDYLGLMATHSPHAALQEDVRERLLRGLGDLIDAEFSGSVTEYYVAEAFLGRKPR